MDERREISIAGLVCAQHLLKKDPKIGIELCEQVGIVAARSAGLWKFNELCLLFQMQQIEHLGVRELARPHIEKILSVLKYKDKSFFHDPLITCLMLRFITQMNRGSDASGEPYPDYRKYIKSCMFDGKHRRYEGGDAMVAIEGLRLMKQLRNISSREVEAAKRAVSMQLSKSANDVMWYGGFRAMHEDRIQSHLEADYDVAQVIKNKTQAPATHNLRRRGLLLHY